MTLKLFANTEIAELENAFSRAFPFLRLRIAQRIANPAEMEERSVRKYFSHQIDTSGINMAGTVVITGRTTAAELKQVMKSKFGLDIKVFRRTELGWIEIAKSAGLMLEWQNRKGRKEFEAVYSDSQIL